MVRTPLTLLQRGVITRLKAAGFGPVAERALIAWKRGQRAEDAGSVSDPQLRADYERANAQAATPGT